MTAVLIPSSPSTEDPKPAPSIVQEIVEKIHNGTEKVTNNDLEQLRLTLTTESTVPYLSRKFLKTCPTNPVMVRFIGMVQDMLNPEYYVSKVNGLYTKYRDCHATLDEDDIDSSLLQECHPFIVVPIPCCTEWFNNTIVTQTTTNNCITVERGNIKRKRSLQDSIDDIDMVGNSEEIKPPVVRKLRATNTMDREPKKGETNESPTDCKAPLDCDWWPKGYMASDINQSPVLAKLYYQDDKEQNRLQLNDVVEIIGMVCVDDHEARFRDQCEIVQTSGIDERSCFNNEQEDVFNDFADPLVIPPSSILPRLHVLQYKKIHLDIMANRALEDIDAVCKRSMNKENDGRAMCIQTFSKFLFNKDDVAAEALLMTLMSMAEREQCGQKPILMPTGTTLGCASLNLVFPDSTSCDIMCRRLGALLELICPIKAVANLSLTALNRGEIPSESSTPTQHSFISTPKKSPAGRLIPTVMQLPRASCFIINQGPMTEGVVNENGQRTLGVLAKMTKNHVIPYQFEGNMEIDFEFDLRTIVLSTSPLNARLNSPLASGSKLLPCSITVSLKAIKPQVASADDCESCAIPVVIVTRIRQYIAKCRGIGKSNIGLTPELLSRAQHDFVERRKENRHQLKNCATAAPSNGKETTEEDFHRWLTLTRLQARSRIGNSNDSGNIEGAFMAKAEDWEASLRLDNLMKM